MPGPRLILRIVWQTGDPSTASNAGALLGWSGLEHLDGVSTEFGLQRGRSEVVAGISQPDGTLLFETVVEPYVDKAGRQRFRGECVQGPPEEPFVYLSWRVTGAQGWIGRRKLLLTTLTPEVLATMPEAATLQTTVDSLGHRAAGSVQEWTPV